MMGSQIIEWDTARSLLDRALLNVAGLAPVCEWGMRGRANQPYTVGHLRARPHVVAHHRPQETCIVRLMRGVTPQTIANEIAAHGALDAAVVCASLRAQGLETRTVRIHWLFEDGGRIEAHCAAAALHDILRRAERVAAGYSPSLSATQQIAMVLARGAR